MRPAARIDGRRADDFARQIRRYAPQYTPDLDLADQGVGSALVDIFARLAEAIALRLDRAPAKHFVAFLDRLGIVQLPATPAKAAVTFTLASGLESPVLVPAGARVSAPGKDGDIPFETEADLRAIPGAVQAVFGADPVADKVFQPPPGFLAPEPKAATALVYRVQSFATAERERLQLDHVTDLDAGAFLLIDGREKRVVARKPDEGNIVTLDRPLERDVEQGAVVTPIRDFEVFDGIDRQEHVLYLGDSRVLATKDAAEITLLVTLVEGPGPKPAPLELAWQFWTKTDTPDDKGHWEPLGLTADTTRGLSTSGTVVLAKPAELEIKSSKVGPTETRWIRGVVSGGLAPGAALPVVDSIQIGIGSAPAPAPAGAATGPKGIKPDQGFYNVTPLDLQVSDVGFFPFGTEPRLFDQFYIASKEGFSKSGAKITLDFTLDLETVATPSIVNTGSGLRAYAVGLRRRLYELDLTNGTWQTRGSPTPPAQGPASLPIKDAIPSAISDAANKGLTFVATESQQTAEKTYRLWVHAQDASATPPAAVWNDLGSPGPYELSNPVAVRLPPAVGWAHFARVFVVAGSKLWSRGVGDDGRSSVGWVDHGKLGGVTQLDPRPCVVVAGTSVLAFVGSDRGVLRFVLQPNLTGTWDSVASAATPFAVISRPFAVPTTLNDARVFVFATTPGSRIPRLFECDTGATPLDWKDLLAPPETPELKENEVPSTPAGYIEATSQPLSQEGKHVFVRGKGNSLWQRLDGSSGEPNWVDHGCQGTWELRGSPAVYVDGAPGANVRRVTVVSATTANSLVRWVFERRTGAAPGTLGGPTDRRAVLLAQSIPGAFNGQLLTVTKGSTSEAHPIDAYDAVAKLARTAAQFTMVVPDQTAECEIGNLAVGKARDGFDRAFVLHDAQTDDISATASLAKVGTQWVAIDSYSRPAGVVVMVGADTVALNDSFELFAELLTGTNVFRATGDADAIPELSWEYWNGRGWLSLSAKDTTSSLLTDGTVTIDCLPAIMSTEVAGQENYWMRARLVGGDYGRETFTVSPTTGQVVSDKSSLQPPKVLQVLIEYTAQPVTPEACVTANNLDYLDQTAANQLAGAHFPPFQPLDLKSLALFIGLDQPFQTGPVRLLLDAAERDFEPDNLPTLSWEFRKDHEWRDLGSDDESVALTRPGVLTLSASAALTRDTLFGQSLYWIRGTLKMPLGATAADYPRPLLKGLFLNTVSAEQGETVTDEILGSSDGEPGQRHTLQRANVLGAAQIRVQEPLSSAERQQLERDRGADSVVERSDIGGSWVRWAETRAFFNCGPNDRVYSLDRAAGELRFGDGVHGRIPPAGTDNIRAFRYRTGGGAAGNVAAGAITTLVTAVAGVDSVLNPTAAAGGSDATNTDQMLTIGPRQISHRGRAVSTTDFEELACQASRQVAKARCLAITNLVSGGPQRCDPCDSRQRHEARPARGWVSLIIVPQSADPLPCPSLQLRRVVAAYLRDRAPGLVASGARIVVRPPDYVMVSVTAGIRVVSIDQVAQVESEARDALETLLHPLRGGADGTGWEFGRPLSKSDVFAVLERVRNLDRVESLTFSFGGRTSTEAVTIGPNELIAGGKHILNITTG